MKHQIAAEVNVLSRVIDLLTEKSVSSLVEHDRSFAEFVEELCIKVDGKVSKLQEA
ncbi:MAG: hypothetical protein JWO41_508 [Candidatus Saccharibacteria bacterium]|nr:hypothetical protein [Candidatus Saccharibacteria bacterium]